jgi:hypothetical protein
MMLARAMLMAGLVAGAGAAQAYDCAAGLPYHSIGAGVLGGYDYEAIGDGWIMVDSTTAHPSGEWIVVEHCPTRMHLDLLGDPALPVAARDDLARMLNSDQGYTLRQMADVILEIGVTTSIGQGQADSCPCALEAGS